MSYSYNPFTNNLDLIGKGGSAPAGEIALATDSGTAISVSRLLNMNGGGGIEVIANPNGSQNIQLTIKVVTPGAYPYTTTALDGLILVDTSSAANTIVPLANPTTGQKHIIKDKSGNAGTAGRNITITPSGKNIDGAASSTININYGSVTIIYNGTEWSIV